MGTPNLFRSATSELSQDAVLAHLLSWAHPDYRDTQPSLNRLGERLLRSLVSSSTEARRTPDPLRAGLSPRLNEHGLNDLPATQDRLLLAMQLVETVCGKSQLVET